MKVTKFLIILVLLLNILNAEKYPSIILLGKFGAEYSQMENISKTHNNPFIPTISAGFEIPALDFLHIYFNYNYARKMGYPYMTTLHLDSNFQIISRENWIDKDGTYLIEKTQLLAGLKGRIKISGFYVNCGIGISPYIKAIYTTKSKLSSGTNIEKGFAGYVYSIDIEKNLTENLLIRLSADYLQFHKKVAVISTTQSGTIIYLQVGYRLKIKTI